VLLCKGFVLKSKDTKKQQKPDVLSVSLLFFL